MNYTPRRRDLPEWKVLNHLCFSFYDWDGSCSIDHLSIVRLAAIRNKIRNPPNMLEKSFLMPLVHWANTPYLSSVLGRGVTRVEAGDLLDFLFLPTLSFLFFP